MIRRSIIRCLLSASVVGVAAAPAPAAAQQIDRIVAFGDSYADTGIAKATMIGDPLAPDSLKAILNSLYPTGRFSGGTNYIDTLADILNVPVENYAVGGALAGTFPVPFGSGTSNNTNCGPGVVAGSPAICPLGFTYEVDQFTNTGTQNPLFPAGSGTLDEGDLVVVSIGGNDARYYQQNYSAFPSAPFIAGSIAGANASLDRLVAAGAPTISFLAGDTGRLPEVAGDPAAAAIRSAYSSTFNTAMQSTLAGYAADGVIVHYLDLNTLGDEIIANPAAYGLTSAGPCPAAEVVRCVTDASFVNQYLFYVDGLHLTSAGFAIVARYVAAQVDAPLTLQAPADAGLDTARQFGRTLNSRSDLYRGDQFAGLRLYAIGDTYSRDVPESSRTFGFDIDGVGGTIGAEYGFAGGAVGAAVNYTRPEVNFHGDAAQVRGKTWQLGAYGNFASGGLFGQGYLGYGKDNNDIDRRGVIDELESNPDGSHAVAGVKAGYLIPIGNLFGVFQGVEAGPIVALDYARAKVDGYTETGDPALTLNVSKQSVKSTAGQIGLEARANVEGVRPYTAVVAEHDFSGNGRVIRFSQTVAPTIVNLWDVEGDEETYGRIISGATANLWAGATIDWSMSSTFGRDNGREFGMQLGLRAAF
ncbi:autotransporter domain-containing protein [Sphingomonas hankyongi]|uniref:Autotransporter domain-containing protein n=1 Tax=Sphingomonas hankyongi TaxID=2908209 RepID=A0ABT0RZ63_9SPHN|nr:autotransporter domain-containing protein [Sphingomonas hankyongi]MCL6728756.1 autotransporter domain-containing protein [Sphingomonas hankyongi]